MPSMSWRFLVASSAGDEFADADMDEGVDGGACDRVCQLSSGACGGGADGRSE